MLGRVAAVAAMAWLAVTGTVAAQPGPTPVLVAKDYFSDDGERPAALRLARLDVETDIVGVTARTVVVAQFENPTERSLEADFTLDMPVGSVVTGYALNVGSGMVDGVLVGRRQATQAYEDRIERRIDPGLAEVTRTNAFHTRVFPVLQGQGRTIRVEFVSPLTPDGRFVLPLEVAEPVGQVSVKVTVDGAAASTVMLPKALTPQTGADGDRHVVSAAARDVSLSGAIEVRPDERPSPVILSRHRTGDVFFEIDDAAPGKGTAKDVDRVRIYWDASVSRLDDGLEREMALVRAYLTASRARAIDLVLFADGKPQVRSLASVDEVETALKGVRYMGANSLRGLFATPLPTADACLFFSDGRVTLDSYAVENAGCPLFAVSSADDADRGFLRALSAKSDGDYLDLATRKPEDLLPILLRASPRVVAVAGADGRKVDFRVLPAAPGRFRIIGRAPSTQPLTVRLAGAFDGSHTYDLTAATTRRHDGIGALWASARIGEMEATDRPDRHAVLALARRYSVASPAAAFLVLETVEDYGQAEIEPPASATDMRTQYKRLTAAAAAEKAEARADRLDEVIGAWEKQKAWWNTRFVQQAKLPRTDRPAPPRLQPVPPPPPTMSPSMPAAAEDGADGGVEALVVTAQKREEAIQDVPISISAFTQESLGQDGVPGGTDLLTLAPKRAVSIQVEEWNPDRPYLHALMAAAPGTFWSVYAAQEREHGAIPAFYLDVAEYLFRKGRAADARAVVTGALDLPSANTGTVSIVADRMMRYGDTQRGVWLYDKVLFLEPDRPQPRRALALALIDRVEKRAPDADTRRDYARAMALLSEVILTPWDTDYDGIELVALMEANRIVPRLRALGFDPGLDPRLIALLDVDVRVVLEWNTDRTDMDLWVKEPNGEQAMYSLPLTSSGGHMSNDMTEGYGPEEYLLRRAPDGRYEIRVDTYAIDRLNPNGATTVRARVFRGYGRRDETSEILELELTPDTNDEALVGVVTVGRVGR